MVYQKQYKTPKKRNKTNKRKQRKRNTRKNANPVPKLVIVKIWAKWCGHCQALEPEWEKMQVELVNNKGIKLESIEESDYDNGIQQFNQTWLPNSSNKVAIQQGYPTIAKVNLSKQTVDYYTGERVSPELIKWIYM